MSIAALLVASVAGLLAAAGGADDPRFETEAFIGPGFVDAGSTVLVKATWEYLDTRTLNRVSVRFTLPAGWTLVEDDPDVCSQTGAIVTCPRARIRPGDPPLVQAVELQTSSATGDNMRVLADLLFSEGPDNPGRVDVVPALPIPETDVISTTNTPNKTGKCLSPGGATIATEAGADNSEASAEVPASPTDELCTPFSIDENARSTPSQACLPLPYTCTLDIVTTESTSFDADDPIKLRIIFRKQQMSLLPLIFTSTTRQITVPECTDDDTAIPDDPCWSDRKLQGNKLTYWVNWTGNDPGWTG